MPDPLSIQVQTPAATESIRLDGRSPIRTIAEILRHENLPLNTRCGLRGICDGCLVEVTAGKVRHRGTNEVIAAGREPITIRGCEHFPIGPELKLRVTARSLLAYAPQVVTNFRVNVPIGRDPLGGPVRPGDLGVAIDIGTTTVALMLVDLNTGQVVSSAANFNRQMHLGDDVLTRINLCSTDKSMIARLRAAVIDETIIPLLRQARAQSSGAVEGQIKAVTVAANTTMLHLFAGADPTTMGFSPFTPVFLEHRVLDGAILPAGGSLSPSSGTPGEGRGGGPQKTVSDTVFPPIHLLPGCSAYVGADLSAGIFATGLLYDDGPSMLVDIGTNGEIVLKHAGKLYGTATAAGPAFEGAALESGMRAGDGAISHVRFDRSPFAVHTEIIGQDKKLHATGICGSAYVDFLAAARETGLISATGRFGELDIDHHIGNWKNHGRAIRLAWAAGREPIVISEQDIAKLMQAKAAIAAGILTLLNRVGLHPADVKTLYLAGGFGMHIGVPNAIASGLLPHFRPDQVQVVGNTSLAGAYLTLLDRNTLPELERIRTGMEIVELNLDPGFEGRYIDALCLP